MRRSPEHSSSPTSSSPPRTSNFRHLRRRNLKLRERRARSKRFPKSDGFSLASTFSKRTDPRSTTASISDPDPSVRSSKYEASSSDRSRSGQYINVVAVPVFHGRSDECPFTHLSRFRKVCGANNADSVEMMMRRIFPVTLEDEAALLYDLNIEPYFQSLSWADIRASFSEAHGLSVEIRSFVVGKRPESLDDALRLAFKIEKAKEVRAARKVLMESGSARRNVVLNSVEEVASEFGLMRFHGRQ
uniref:Uncharacterized protein n=1 Tax=Kalanchoe fedtschenkoi TaxID=63787 RepID=A0A7N0TYJ9_KALFE